MHPVRHSQLLRAILASCVLTALAVSAQADPNCKPTPPGSVSLIVLQSSSAVHELAGALRGTIVARDDTTVLFADGRVISSDVGKVGDHLNTLGWAERPIRMVSSLPARRAPPRGSSGFS